MRKAKALGVFVILLVLSSTISAGYAAAWDFNLLGDAHSTMDRVGNGIKGAIAGGIAGAIAGSVIPGVGTLLGAIGGAIIGGILGASIGGGEEKSSSHGATVGAERYANASSVVNDTDNSFARQTEDLDKANQEAYSNIEELGAKVRSDLVVYDYIENGSTGDLWARIYAPSKIYGFSAFPVQVFVHVVKSNIPLAKVHIQEVSVWVAPANSSVKLWKRTWKYNATQLVLNGGNLTYSTILKVPDNLSDFVTKMIKQGYLNRNETLKLFNTSTKPWQIVVEVKGFREKWIGVTGVSNCTGEGYKEVDGTCYKFVRNDTIDYKVMTTSAWKHVTMANDVALISNGMYGSLPVKFVYTPYSRKWVIYKEKFAGALSDILIITMASPVHVMGSTADFKFFFTPNPDYFKPLNVTFSDDYRFIIAREDQSLHWTAADQVNGTLGNISDTANVKTVTLTGHYTTANGTLTYYVLSGALFRIKRDDNVSIPIWIVAMPEISVLQNIRPVIADNQTKEIAQFTSDGKLTADELNKTRKMAYDWINGLEDKISAAEQLYNESVAENNTVAAKYAQNAISEYKAAIGDLRQMINTDDPQMILNYLNAAKKHEQAGDYYYNAALKALHGDYEQAQIDADDANQTSKLAGQYEPGFGLSLGALALGGLTEILIILVIAFVIALIAYILAEMFMDKKTAKIIAAASFIIVIVLFLLL